MGLRLPGCLTLLLPMTLIADTSPDIHSLDTKLWLDTFKLIQLWGLLVPAGFGILACLDLCGPCSLAQEARAPGL